MQAASIVQPPLAPVRTAGELAQLEATTRVYDLFCWLAWRFTEAFQVSTRQAFETMAGQKGLCPAVIIPCANIMQAAHLTLPV